MDEIVHLRVCSEYSLLYSSARITEVVQRVKQHGMSALGVADRRGMYGALTCYQAIHEAGLLPIIGQTIQVGKERLVRAEQSLFELVLIATSMEGYRSLTKLSSLATLQEEDGLQYNTWDELAAHSTGLLCLTGGIKGPLQEAVQRQDITRGQKILQGLMRIFGTERVYVELQGQGLLEEVKEHRFLAELAKTAQLPLVATSEVRYVQKTDLQVLDVLTGIREGISSEAAMRLRAKGATYDLRSPAEMRELFAEFPDALRATVDIARQAQFELPLQQWSMPRFPLPEGRSEEEELAFQAKQGLIARQLADQPVYQERLENELRVITRMGFSGYFLIVWDFMKFAHEQGISTGPGRGSAAGSLVSFVLQITDVDPIANHLLFERFLNPERVSWPDIDIDFEAERRHEVIAYVAQKYGKECVGHIGTLGTFAARAAVRDVGRVLGTAQVEIDRLARAIPATPGITLQAAIAAEPELKRLLTKFPHLQRVVDLALRIEGLPRHASLHAAGIVISKEPLAKLVPLMRGSEEVVATQYGMDDIAAIGLLKMDFLGLRTLTICDRAREYIQAIRQIEVRFDKLPMDQNTIALLAAGDTDGCFQLESAGVKQVLRELAPTTLEDLIAVISLYRPGPMEQIGTFIKVRRGELPVVYEVPELEPILRSTYGILVYQEQIMQIAATLAGFSLGEADVLRRAVSKKQRDVLDQARASFVAGCLANGYSESLGNQVYDLIVRFADYGFNRSHAAAYTMLAHRTAYLKANYRPEYMAALMTDAVSRPDKLEQYARACARAGIAVLGPDLNRSQAACVPERRANGEVAIRLGLAAVKHVGVAAVEQIVHAREQGGAFSSLQDLYERVDARALTRRVIESLIQSGAFDSFGISRRKLLLELDRLVGSVKAKMQGGQLTMRTLFDEPTQSSVEMIQGEALPDDPKQCALWEQELIGFIVSYDPFQAVREAQQRLHLPSIQQIIEEKGVRTEVQMIGKVAVMRQVATKKGDPMGFLTLEDHTARVELVIFPVLFQDWMRFQQGEDLLQVAARRDPNRENVFIAVKFQEIPPSSVAARKPQLFIRISADLERDRQRLIALRQTLLKHPGNVPVTLIYASGKQRTLDVVKVALTAELLDAVTTFVGREGISVYGASGEA
ncbi:DNA polymerase III subunit alpha [Sulfoacidibacillus thermotolerans]|uniref:DNA polymerase III subunit alpha n=1 Tax=Sulfoacidibacillus thermotolerans TaxID=1765684 RepID=UPI0015E80BAD|nr:DNA polymerase III subunit alpha [Sulfoacidibacillus thermotolerans]